MLISIFLGALQRLLKPVPPRDIEITNTTLGGVQVRVYKLSKEAGTGDDKLPGLVFQHGGGWFMGSVGKKLMHGGWVRGSVGETHGGGSGKRL